MALKIENLIAHRGSFSLSIDSPVEVGRGECVSVLGRSGAGKTTLLDALSGFVSSKTSRISVDGKRIDLLYPEHRRIAYVFQKSYLFPHLSVFENIVFAKPVLARVSIEPLARELEIEDLLDRKPSALSEGQAQRVAIARSLIADFPVLLLDEPFSALDERTRGRTRRLLKREIESRKVCALLVTHSWEDAEEMGARGLWLEAGRVERQAPVRDLRARFGHIT